MYVCMYVWGDGCKNVCMEGWVNECMDEGWMDEGCMDVRTVYGWMKGVWMYELCMDG